MGKKGPKWAESRVLLSLPKVLLLIFGRRNLTKMKEINIFFFPCKSHIWGNSGSPAKKLLSNQIAESFDHQYLGKQFIIIFVLCLGDIHQEKGAYETTTFWCVQSCLTTPKRAQTSPGSLSVALGPFQSEKQFIMKQLIVK